MKKLETCLQCEALKPCSDNIAFCTRHKLRVYRCEAKKCRICEALCKQNYYVCPIAKTCLDGEECRAFTIAQVDNTHGNTRQSLDENGAVHYEFETVREFSLGHAVREAWKRGRRTA